MFNYDKGQQATIPGCHLHCIVENAPPCYRAPKWPDLEFPRKIKKKKEPKFWNPKKTPPNYRKKKLPKTVIFSVFSRYFQGFLGGKFWSPEFRAGFFFFFFSVFFVEIRGRAIWGLCSRPGPSQVVLFECSPVAFFLLLWLTYVIK